MSERSSSSQKVASFLVTLSLSPIHQKRINNLLDIKFIFHRKDSGSIAPCESINESGRKPLNTSIRGEFNFVAWKAPCMSMHVCMCVCMLSCTFAGMFGYIHTGYLQTHTHMTCVCFVFSILGCFVAVLGAAAQKVEAEEEEEEEGEVLDRHRCLLALAALRHAKWFQVGTHSLPVFVPDACCSLTFHPERLCSSAASRVTHQLSKLKIFSVISSKCCFAVSSGKSHLLSETGWM